MEKLYLLLPGRRTCNFWNSDFLIFPTFKQILLRILWKKIHVSKQILKVLIKFYRFTNIYDLKFLGNETTALWIFFLNLHGRAFCFLSSKGNIKTSISLILLKCNVVGYSNGNDSFTGRLFSNYGLLNMLFHFFRYHHSVFHDKSFMKKMSFFSSNFKISFKM